MDAEDFSHSDRHGVVSYKGMPVAALTHRGWIPIEALEPGGNKQVWKAVWEALFSLPNDASAGEVRREIVSRLFD